MDIRHAKPRPVRSVLTAVLESLRLGDPVEAGLMDRLAEAAGPEFAPLCAPERLEGGRLTVTFDHPAMHDHLNLRREALVERINTFLGRRTVTEIRMKPRRYDGR